MNSSIAAFAGRRIDPICSKRPALTLEAVSLASAKVEAYPRWIAPAAIFSAAATMPAEGENRRNECGSAHYNSGANLDHGTTVISFLRSQPGSQPE